MAYTLQTVQCERNYKCQSKIQMWSEICPNMVRYKQTYITLCNCLSNSSQIFICTCDFYWLATWCLSSLCTNPQKGLCLDSSQKNLKITNSDDVKFISTFFFKSQHNAEKNQNKYLTLQLKAVNWHYSWKLLSFCIFSGQSKYIWN
jgi:hypothetical protein